MKLRTVIFLFIFLFFSCGIDDIIYLISPISVHDPTSHVDNEQKYFEFRTSDKNNTDYALDYFKGFDIFYRIYESESDCSAAITSAFSYNASNPSAAVTYLLSSLSFSLLKCTSASPSPLISSASFDRNVRFRLIEYSTYKAEITVNEVSLGGILRANNKDFSSILKTDSDVKTSSSSSKSTELYVAFFAAAYGSDHSFRPFYSGITKLGYVKIPKPW